MRAQGALRSRTPLSHISRAPVVGDASNGRREPREEGGRIVWLRDDESRLKYFIFRKECGGTGFKFSLYYPHDRTLLLTRFVVPVSHWDTPFTGIGIDVKLVTDPETIWRLAIRELCATCTFAHAYSHLVYAYTQCT